MAQSSQQDQLELIDEAYTALFCRALYDYDAQDSSALSFRRNDIIEVLTQQPSGWWDGLLGDERGWFPSNYVTIITDEEAELAFSGSDFSNADGVQETPARPARHSIVDMSHAMMGGSQAENEQWLDNELTGTRDAPAAPRARQSTEHGTSPSDFWMPQVAPNGQIFYVNTKTGQQSRDLPLEAEDEASDSDVAGLTSQSSSRSGTSAGLGLGANGNVHGDPYASDSDITNGAGFLPPRSTGTPEPWIKRLADDGSSYYYFNKVDNSMQWTRPTAKAPIRPLPPNNSSALRPTPPTNGNRLSVYSDSSDVQPADMNPVRAFTNGNARPRNQSFSRDTVIMQLTSAERIAQSLQQALAPSPPELLPDLSATAKQAIHAVIENIQSNGTARRPEEDKRMDDLIYTVVQTVRHLLYVSAVPTSQIPPNVIPREARDAKPPPPSTSPLKAAQRKVTATLSRLVLSARAMQYDSGSSLPDTLHRIEVDADELERAVLSFVLDVQRVQHNAAPGSPEARPLKRLRGAFATANIGLGLVGAGAAAGWKGFGWVLLDDDSQGPGRILGPDVTAEVASYVSRLDQSISSLVSTARSPDEIPVDRVRLNGKDLVTQMSAFLTFIATIHVARHVDIDGIRQDVSPLPNDLYTKTIDKARSLVRSLETAVQSLYDDSASLLLSTQSMKQLELSASRIERDVSYGYVDVLSTSMRANLAVVQQMLEALLAVGHEQSDMAQGDYNGSIEWRMTRLSVIETQFGGAIRPTSSFLDEYEGRGDGDDVVDLDFAISRPTGAAAARPPNQYSNPYEQMPRGNGVAGGRMTQSSTAHTLSSSVGSTKEASTNGTTTVDELLSADSDEEGVNGDPLYEEEDDFPPPRLTPRSGRKTDRADKLRKMMGEELPPTLIGHITQDEPWYLRPTYDPAEIIIEPDGTVKGGSLTALVERLTAHTNIDRSFIDSFLMTFKSFTTLDELFDLLVQRFWIQAPPKLTTTEREQWVKLKQHIVQTRVFNILKQMVIEPDILEKEDAHILPRIKEFCSQQEISGVPAARQLVGLIERSQAGADATKLVSTSQASPPAPIMPKIKGQKLKLMDIEPLELARQLTLFESALFQKIRPVECLQRAREQKTENMDNITNVIQISNRIAMWVAEAVLSKDDSRRRATTVKHLISVADRCRSLNNFSTMIAITSGLNTPPIRRLKRTWEQVNQRYMAQFGACEMTIDSNKNFNKYRSLMATVDPPCVPFIGVFLSTLQFIQDGNPDNLPGGLVNFKKRGMAAEVINDIKRWQALSFNFTTIPAVQVYIEDSLAQYGDSKAASEHFWELSLDREPREREDEKMARLLQESGFL